ncbi:midasin-like isoform X2 [Hydractinia symbiolongicarpus]|uniref:midasin-like isoform X2 n=1 Tax=Hydractinia symbiolongicarpus TaxID=13093 RepID=UPI00254D01B1|nr:midasin-like isoform X2 [Hydractinia symbiolongicarpus]
MIHLQFLPCQTNFHKVWSISDKNDLLHSLSMLLLSSEECLSGILSSAFAFLLPELYFRAVETVTNTNDRNLNFSSLLASLLRNSCEILNYGVLVEKEIFRLLQWMKEEVQEFVDNFNVIFNYLSLLITLMDAGNCSCEQICSLEHIHTFTSSSNVELRWYSFKILSKSLNITDTDSYMQTWFTLNEYEQMMLKDSLKRVNHRTLSEVKRGGHSASRTLFLDKSNFRGNYVPVMNFLFTFFDNGTALPLESSMVLTNSMYSNLKSLICAVLSKSAVLLSGEMGCGKTTLVEYLAGCLGRTNPPGLLKLQLGDQTDSKSLLGTYMCCEQPGTFKWQPGSLTQAVMQGSWVLFEDIDAAPPDVMATLVSLIKSKCLIIPGHGEEITPAAGFQIFATTRSGHHSFSQNQNISMQMLEKLCHRIHMEAPNKQELIQIVQTRFNNLSSIASKMVDIYSLVSSDVTLESDNDVAQTKLSAGSRQSTPRDLLKWCCHTSRSIEQCNQIPAQECIFLKALNCFCLSVPKIKDRHAIAYSVGAKLGLTKEKVEYYLYNYKPTVVKTDFFFKVGEVKLNKEVCKIINLHSSKQRFSFTRHSLKLLEDIAEGVMNNEPILLVGETGCGKTSTVQFLAEQCGQTVNVVNMSQQSDMADLLGGFKPMDMGQVVKPLKEMFVDLFIETYSQKQNLKFLGHVDQCFGQKKWSTLIKLFVYCCQKALGRKKKDTEDDEIFKSLGAKWEAMLSDVNSLEKKLSTQEGLVFNFVEGTLVKSIRSGYWILLDEINLATAETLQCLSGLLDSQSGSMVLTERGDINPITRHKNFRLFACMNPATDVGKKDLPYGIRNRFSEIYVDEMDDASDLKTLVAYYLNNLNVSSDIISGIVNFYFTIRNLAKDKLVDGSGYRPHYSLRTLCRGLQYAVNQLNCPPLRAVYEGLCMSFLTQLDRPSHPLVTAHIKKNVFTNVKNVSSVLSSPLPKPQHGNNVSVQGYWISVGSKKAFNDKGYVVTTSVRKNLQDLARVVAGRKYPVLLQGETSVGKTSLISYLAKLTGNHCVRINNHEHTDIQEYIGCYGADDNGNLIFKEGVLVTAMRRGYWIILDELNLAPTDVLEALNRLLDDNRELFIAETQETIKAHPHFMLFATQNPPGHYGGRKILSRAFRNRFVELHFDEIPSKELEEILHKRCNLPQSYCRKFVKVMLDLRVRRRNSGIFAGKHSFMTLRDLFRWAERYRLSENVDGLYDWEQCICEDGYLLIAGRCRKEDETFLIKEVLEQNFKKKINLKSLYGGNALSSSKLSKKVLNCTLEEFKHIVWTSNMKRLAFLVGRALQFGEAVLLVGETGCGKTTICQLFASINAQQLYAVNCHMHTESADFLGGLRPVRAKDTDDKRLFEWCDGPLVNAMREGQMFLIDEISLADDSVLERLNSVLETDRLLVLSEKGEVENKVGNIDIIKAKESFRLIATMNPGGDFGKKELSPALRNRFTEIWCSPSDSYDDLKKIIEHNIKYGLSLKAFASCQTSGFGDAIVDFLKWFKETEIGNRFTISIRDLLSWVQFVNTVCKFEENDAAMEELENLSAAIISAEHAYVHGACLVFIDSIGSGNSSQVAGTRAASIKTQCINFLHKQVGLEPVSVAPATYFTNRNTFSIGPFHIPKGHLAGAERDSYNLSAKTTLKNALHLLRGLQLTRPILLEGSPGVGKTSLVMAVARLSGHNIVRINLSEETDVSDLFGSDLPVEGATGGTFAWRDGPLLKALKAGIWVVFDELNLASQSVLEGLNACFDHRAEVYVPELNKTFQVQKEKTKIFACQNPLREGGGRKGLPKSFLNRFTKVYVDAMTPEDFHLIIKTAFPQIDEVKICNMIKFNATLHKDIVVDGKFGRKGSPWEFNIRDIVRWCELLSSSGEDDPGKFVGLLYQDRMRIVEDKHQVIKRYQNIFKDFSLPERCKTRQCHLKLTSSEFTIGSTSIKRHNDMCSPQRQNYQLLRSSIPHLESLMMCVKMKWLAILVGSEATGKNSLVHILSNLSGKKLDVLSMNSGMDTSDFVGGFEQLNVSFHIKKFYKDVSALIDTMLCHCLQHNPHGEFTLLFQIKEKLLENLQAVTHDNERNLDELSASFDVMMDKYNQVLQSFSALRDFKEKLTKLRQTIAQSRESKGQFEWVDGIFVNALKKGHWLLIENVNFCSSSILDRLNALLEPNGVLTIDERGVINGEIPKVVPHPKFRLFMSMDPKYGEISRAMRNRGVEIYIPSERDGVILDTIDINLLMKSQALSDHSMISFIQKIHLEVKRNNNNVRSSKMLQASSLTSKLLTNGCSKETAVKQACYEVYCKSELTFHIKMSISQFITEASLDEFHNSKINSLIPCVNDYCDSPTLVFCQRDSIPIQTDVFQDTISSNTALLLFIERSSASNMILRLSYLTQHLTNSFNLDSIMAFRKWFLNAEVQNHDESHTICESLNYYPDCVSLHAARKYFFLLIQQLYGLDQVLTDRSPASQSIMSISKSFTEGKLSTTSLQHKSLMFIYKFCNLMLAFIRETWFKQLTINETSYFAMLENSFAWFYLFVGYCKTEIPRMSISTHLFSLSSLALHWKWLKERFLINFISSVPNDCKFIIDQLDMVIGHDQIGSIMYGIVNLIGRPKGFLYIGQFEMMNELLEMYNQMQCESIHDSKTSLRHSVIGTVKEVWCNKTLKNDVKHKANMLKSEMQEYCVTGTINPMTKNCLVLSKSIFHLSLCGFLTKAVFCMDDWNKKYLEVLLQYGFTYHIANGDQLMVLDTFREYNNQKHCHILPYLQSNMYSVLFNAVSTFFLENDDLSSSTKRITLSPSFPILSILQDLINTDSKDYVLDISLQSFRETMDMLSHVHVLLWSNMDKMLSFNSIYNYHLNLQSWCDNVKILNALGTTFNKGTHHNLVINEADYKINRNAVIGQICHVMKTIDMSSLLLPSTSMIVNTIIETQEECTNNVSVKSAETEQIFVAMQMCLSGLLILDISRPYLKYDPVEEVSMRLKNLKEQLYSINTELKVRYDAEYIWSGFESPSFKDFTVKVEHFTSNPERVHTLLKRREMIASEIQAIQDEETIRPTPSEYNVLYQDFQHFMETIGDISKILSLIKEQKRLLLNCTSSLSQIKSMLSVVQKSKLWVNSADKFVEKIKTSFPLYNDITLLPCYGLQKCKNGSLIMIDCINQKLQQLQFSESATVHLPSQFFDHLCNSHANRPIKNTEYMCRSDVVELINYLSKDTSGRLVGVQSTVLSLALFSLKKHFCFGESHKMFAQDHSHFFTLLKIILDYAYLFWCDQKQKQIEEEEKKASLYKFRAEIHCEEKTDEEETLESQNKLFPTFENEFEDLIITDSLNNPESAEKKENSNESKHDVKIDEDVIFELVRDIYFHRCEEDPSTLMNNTLVQQALKLLKIPQVFTCLDYETVPYILLLTISKMLDNLSKDTVLDPTVFNIYSDHCVHEALQTRDILIEFTQYIESLLSQFEEHPALLQIKEIIQRILSFSIYSPLMKFVTGFELLLKQAQNWEMYAGKHVSLRKHLEDISSKVIEWRKLELKSWPLLLEKAEKKITQSVSKWFFQFYNLMEESRKKEEAGIQVEKDAVVIAVKEFFEGSTIGEFQARLEMIETILMHLQTHNICKDLQNGVWNVFMYYTQFVTPVLQFKQDAKRPIEKELKDYVKIAKWNDINFYAMKEAVDKSHRTLNKFVRRYERVLQEPIQQFLQDTKKFITPSPFKGKQFYYDDSKHEAILLTQTDVLPIDDFGDLYLNKINNLQLKIKKYMKEAYTKMKYGMLIENLDGFTGDIIDSIKELQTEDVLALPKEKQKSARTNLQQRKRKALANLFKELKLIGISYRKGQQISEDIQINLPIIKVQNFFRNDDSAYLAKMLHSCNDYFFGCMAKQAMFQSASLVPSKELGPGEVTRFKGLTAHLFHIACEQRERLHKVLTAHTDISHMVAKFKGIENSLDQESLLPSQKFTKNFLLKVRDHISQSLTRLQYFKELLLACPKNQVDQILSPFSSDELSSAALYKLGDENMNEILRLLQSVTDVHCELKNEMDNMQFDEQKFPLLIWSHSTFITHALSKLQNELTTIDRIVQPFLSPIDSQERCLAEVLVNIKKDLLTLTKMFDVTSQHESQNKSTVTPDLLLNKVETFIQRLLLCVQSVIKKADEYQQTLDDLQDTEVSMLKGHLSPLLTTNFLKHMQSFDLDCIVTSCNDFIKQLSLVFEEGIDESPVYKASLNMLRLLEEFDGLLKFYVFHSIMLHRTCCKLLFVLYELFTNLLKEGYCVPPEEDTSMSGEGATEFEDIQNGGLGEGEGAKDVSEQIESEDQLEDTKHEKSEEQKKEDDEDDIAEEKEGVEMSDDFEGKLQDLEMDEEQSSGEEEENEEDEDEADKQMGDVDDEQETLDEKMWGDSDHEDENKNEKKEEKGKGAEGESESQLVANEDNRGEQEGEEKDRKNEKDKLENDQQESGDFDEQNETDDGTQQEEQNNVDEFDENKEDMDIPDDINLDGDEKYGEDNDDDKNDEDGKDEIKEDDHNEQTEETMDEEQLENQDQKALEKGDEEEQDTRDDKNNQDLNTENRLQQDDATPVDNVEEAPSDVDIKSSTTESSQQENSNDQGVGAADAEGEDGHHGNENAVSKQRMEKQKGRKRKEMQHANKDRSLQKDDIQGAKKRKAMDVENIDDEKDDEQEKPSNDADTFQHMKDDSMKFDELTIDTATKEQLNEHSQTMKKNDDDDVEMENEADVSGEEEEEEEGIQEDKDDVVNKKDAVSSKSYDIHGEVEDESIEEIKNEEEKKKFEDMETDEEREIKTDFFTSTTLLEVPLQNIHEKENFIEELRHELENELVSLSVNKSKINDEKVAMELWMKFEKLTSGLAQQLCEQLRLILEPTVASKMRGDYRTGKRLNMRKVIPYIASQFRKDKIWLRRTKKSKRKYQIIMAVDDSSSMTDNHSKQLAFESLAVISNALRWLEAGDLAVCSFGEEARLIHSFDEPFSEHSGASILQQFTFEQKKTKIAQLLNMCTVLLNDAKSHQRSGNAVSQLLLIVSDGRGIFLEGKEAVLKAASQARESGVFTVFLIVDDPKNRNSILDIKVPIFNPAGGVPEIKSYIEEFPFPFYLLLRDINSLPNVLSDALKQWFELVTQTT